MCGVGREEKPEVIVGRRDGLRTIRVCAVGTWFKVALPQGHVMNVHLCGGVQGAIHLTMWNRLPIQYNDLYMFSDSSFQLIRILERCFFY